MDEFVILRTTADKLLADVMCGALESQQVPVMLEHLQLPMENDWVSAFRLLVPNEQRARALRIIDQQESLYSVRANEFVKVVGY